MQNIQDEPYHVVGDIPAKGIDTGTGLERLAMILQGVDTLFEADCVHDVLAAASGALGRTYGEDEGVDVALRLLADHARASTFLIGDRALPGNEGRGYVVRRLIRRAVRHAWQLGSDNLIMPGLAERGMAIRLARTLIEGTVLVAGWLLGGAVGVGTVVFTITIGPLIQPVLRRADKGPI